MLARSLVSSIGLASVGFVVSLAVRNKVNVLSSGNPVALFVIVQEKTTRDVGSFKSQLTMDSRIDVFSMFFCKRHHSLVVDVKYDE